MSLFHSSEVPISEISHFRFFFTQGYAMYADTSYELDVADGKITATYKPWGAPNENALSKEVSEEFRTKLQDILKELEVGKWNDFDKVDKNVLDGDSFSLSIRFENDDSISASGYMKWPNNFRDFKEKVSALFGKLFTDEEVQNAKADFWK